MDNDINTKGLYIYGIIPTCYAAEKFRELDSINVFNITFEKVSAIVSENSVIDYRQLGTEPLARLLIDHQKTIESLMNMGFTTIIPMRLGTFANNTTEVLKILENGYDLIMEIFEKVTNLLEIDIVATWSDFNKIMAEIAVNPEILELKTKIGKSKNRVTQTDQLTIGYLVKKILDEKNAEYATKIIEALNPFCQSTKSHEVMNDQMVINTAFLVNQGQSALLEKALDQLDERFNGKLNFKLVGPLPCYSFYTLEVKELHFEEIESAKKELGLNNFIFEKDIKQAYLNKVKLFHPDTNPGDDSAVIFNRINKAYQTMLDYVNAVKPASSENQFSLLSDAVAENSFFLKIKE